MAERVVPDDGLVDPDGHAAEPLDEAREIVHPGNVDPRVVAVEGLEGEGELLAAPRGPRPASTHALYSSTTYSRSARNVSSVTKDTGTPWSFAYSTCRTEASRTWARVIRSLCVRWRSEHAMKMEISSAPASRTASTSLRTARAAATIAASSPALGTSRPPRSSPGVKAPPGVCSPSRIVSSQIWIPAGRRPEIPPSTT